jgi:hypothetical protein
VLLHRMLLRTMCGGRGGLFCLQSLVLLLLVQLMLILLRLLLLRL